MRFTLDYDQYAALARQTAAEGCVLLKNEKEALPIRKGETVSVFGRIAFTYYKSGTGSGGMVNVSKVYGIVDGLRESGQVILDEELIKIYQDWEETHPFNEGEGWGNEPWCQEEMELTDEVVEAAGKRSETAIVIIGRTAGEDKDASDTKGSYQLTDVEEDLLTKVRKNFDKMIVLLNVGGLLDMSFTDRYQPEAVMYVWQGGMVGGLGTADVLTGAVSPSGHLTDTIAYKVADYPSTPYFGDPDKNYYSEDIYVGYRYYEKKGIQPAYPFGYGLSYTSFEYEHLAVSEENDHTIVTVDVTNTGAVAAKHVVELFIEPKMKTRLPRPVRELKAFKKIFLQPGEKKQVCFSLERRDFAYYDPKVKDWVIENGAYAIEICHDSMNVAVSAEITKSDEKYLVPLGYDCGFYEMFQYPEVKKMFYEFLVEQGLVTADQVNDNLEKGIIWSFWAVRSYLDMNSNGLISFEAYNRFIDRANEVIKKMKAK